MTHLDLAKQVKAKYPQYQGIDDDTLGKKVLQKYPQYGNKFSVNESPSVSGFVENIGKSAVENVKGMGQALLHPVATAKALGKTALGAGELLVPGEQGHEQYARNVGSYYKDRYGKNLGQTLYNDPVGVALDVSTVAGLGAGGLKLGSKVANVAGKAETASKLSNVASKANTLSRTIDPIQQTTRFMGKVPSKVGRFVENRGEDIAVAGLGSPKKLRQVEGLAGVKFGEFFDKYGLWDRSPESAQKVIDLVSGNYDDLALKSGKTSKVTDIVKAFDDEIAKIENPQALQSDVNRALLQELKDRRQRFISSLSSSKNKIGIEDITKSKRAVQKDIPQTMFGLDQTGTGKAQASRATYDIFKKKIGQLEPATTQLGRDEAALLKLKELFENAQSRGQARQLINFTKLGGTGVGAVLGGLPGAVGGYALESIINSPLGHKVLSTTFRKTGRGLQRVPNARVLKPIKPIYTFSKYSSRVRNDDSRVK